MVSAELDEAVQITESYGRKMRLRGKHLMNMPLNTIIINKITKSNKYY